MDHINAFKGSFQLIKKLGEPNAYLIWSMGLFLDESNLEELASECLTPKDKNIAVVARELGLRALHKTQVSTIIILLNR